MKGVISNHSFSVVFTVWVREPKSRLPNPNMGLLLSWRMGGSYCRPPGCGGNSLNESSFGGLGKQGQEGCPKEFGGWEQRFHRTPDLGGHERGPGTIPKVSEGIPGQGLGSTISTQTMLGSILGSAGDIAHCEQ